MTIHEASVRYKIPMDILKEYESWGLCGTAPKVVGAWQYDDEDLERLGLIMTLHDMGFTSEEVETYMRLTLEQRESEQKRLQMLKRKRDAVLDRLHFYEHQLQRLDYLRYEIQKNQSKKE